MARKTLVLEIDLEGAALAEDFGDYEAQRLLTKAAVQAHDLFDLGDGGWQTGRDETIMDSNGNTVGRMRVETRLKNVAKP